MQILVRFPHIHKVAVIMCRLLAQEKHSKRRKFYRGVFVISYPCE